MGMGLRAVGLAAIAAASAACLTAVDCAMNGECISPVPGDPQQPGKCLCASGWRGEHCERLDLLPSSPSGGLRMPNNESTWGGSIIEFEGTYHMYASHMVHSCGLGAWSTNSEIVHDEPLQLPAASAPSQRAPTLPSAASKSAL